MGRQGTGIKRWLMWGPRTTAIIVFIMFLLPALLNFDPDLGWHLSSGQYIAAHGLPAFDIYTYTASNFPWIHHEWLADVISGAVYKAGGFGWLAVMYAALWTAGIGLFTRWRQPAVIILVGVLAITPYAGVRALTWDIVMLGMLYRLADIPRLYPVLPAVFALWANLHGGFVLGLVYLVFQSVMRRDVRLGATVILSSAATLINPYGLNLYTEIMRTVGDTSLRTTISEWRSFYLNASSIVFIALWAGGIAIANWKRLRTYLGFDMFMFAAALWSTRHFPLFVIFALPVVLRRYGTVVITVPRRIVRRDSVFIKIAGAVLLGVCLASWLWDMRVFHERRALPERSVARLQQSPCRGNLFHEYGLGGYLIWKLPSHKVYIDGRMPSWEMNGTRYLDNFLRVFDDAGFRSKEFARYNIRCVLTKRPVFVRALLGEGWAIDTNNDNTYVLLRK